MQTHGEQTRLQVDLADEEHAAENEALVQAHASTLGDIEVAHSAELAAVEGGQWAEGQGEIGSRPRPIAFISRERGGSEKGPL